METDTTTFYAKNVAIRVQNASVLSIEFCTEPISIITQAKLVRPNAQAYEKVFTFCRNNSRKERGKID